MSTYSSDLMMPISIFSGREGTKGGMAAFGIGASGVSTDS